MIVRSFSEVDFFKYFGNFCDLTPTGQKSVYYAVSQSREIDFVFIHFPALCQIGYCLADGLRGKGQSHLFFKAAFTDVLETNPFMLLSVIDKENVPSRKLIEKFPFKLMSDVGCNNVYVWYSS